MNYKLGMKQHVPDERDLPLERFLNQSAIAVPDGDFGHGDLVAPDQWGMLGNDEVGDCLPAGAAHETMVLAFEGDHHAAFNTRSALETYSEMTGYVPGEESTDQGAEPRSAARYRQKVGILDANGRRHHIGAYLWLAPGDLAQLDKALIVFGVVGVGYELPESAEEQFNQGLPWDVSDAPIAGGHYVPALGRRNGNIDAVSWGRRIEITPAFYERYAQCALVYVSAAALGPEGVTPEGLDKAALVADLNALVNYGSEVGPTGGAEMDENSQDGGEGVASTEESMDSPVEEAAPTGEDISTSPVVGPAPAPGVPSKPVNAVRNEGEPTPAILDPSRIGEALRPPEAESAPDARDGQD